MCFTMPQERLLSKRQCVKNGDPDVIDYLEKTFGISNLYFCRPGNQCMFVCPKQNVQFNIVDPLEYFFDKEGLRRGLLKPGIYRIADHIEKKDYHFVLFQKYENNMWIDYIGCHAGWAGGMMLNWQSIIPVQGELF